MPEGSQQLSSVPPFMPGLLQEAATSHTRWKGSDSPGEWDVPRAVALGCLFPSPASSSKQLLKALRKLVLDCTDVCPAPDRGRTAQKWA